MDYEQELATTALLSLLHSGNYEQDSEHLRRHIAEEFPGSDFEAALKALREAGLIDVSEHVERPTGVPFTHQNHIPLRVY